MPCQTLKDESKTDKAPAVPRTTQAAEHPAVHAARDIRSAPTTEQAWPTDDGSTISRDPVLWHPAMNSPPELDLSAHKAIEDHVISESTI